MKNTNTQVGKEQKSTQSEPDVLFVAFDDHQGAEKYRQNLIQRGYNEQCISKICDTSELEPEQLRKQDSRALPGAVAGAAGFGAAGAALGGAGALLTGGLAASPMFAAVGGCAAAATYGSLAASLYADSEPEREVDRLRQQLRDGKTLIGVRVEGPSEYAEISRLAEHGVLLADP